MNQNHSPLLRRALAEFERRMTPDPVLSYNRIVLASRHCTAPSSPELRWRRRTRITLPARATPDIREVPIPANDLD